MTEAMPSTLAEAIAQAPPAAPADKLAALRAKCEELRDVELEQLNVEEKLAELKAQLTKLRHEVLPDLMDEAGTDKIGLPGARRAALAPTSSELKLFSLKAHYAADNAEGLLGFKARIDLQEGLRRSLTEAPRHAAAKT